MLDSTDSVSVWNLARVLLDKYLAGLWLPGCDDHSGEGLRATPNEEGGRVMAFQKTLGREIQCSGIGLHGGQKVHLTLRPAPPDSGVILRRTDVEGFDLRVGVDSVCDVDHATSLRCGEHRISTIEHLLSALAGLGVDNAIIEADADEIPILDGSSAPFVYLIHEAGIREQSRVRRVLRIRKPVEVTSGDRRLAVYPHDGLKITYSIEFDHPAIGEQVTSYEITPKIYQDEIASARTFGFLREVEMLRKAGLARGGSLENAIVLGDHEILNAPLRYKDEFVRHKILDLIGDATLLGLPIQGHLVAHKAGHGLHAELVRALLADPSCGEIVTDGETTVAPTAALAPLSPETLAYARI